MVPLTIGAFYLSALTVPGQIELFGDGKQKVFDLTAICICGLGVFFYNWFKEK
jgi:hypothetical protein